MVYKRRKPEETSRQAVELYMKENQNLEEINNRTRHAVNYVLARQISRGIFRRTTSCPSFLTNDGNEMINSCQVEKKIGDSMVVGSVFFTLSNCELEKFI